MLHLIAFVAIGLVVGAVLHWGSGMKTRHAGITLVAGLIGALIGGWGLLLVLGYVLARIVSLLFAVLVAIALVWLAGAALGRH